MENNQAELLVLSYPIFAPDDLNKIQTVRNRLDPELATLFPPHVTHLLPLDNSWARSILNAAGEISRKFEPIQFTIKTLTILDNPDSRENFLVLVPADSSRMLALHLELYDNLALPAPYGDDWQPHITLGVSTDRELLISEAKHLKPELAGIEGRLDSLEVVAWQIDELTSLSSLPFKARKDS